HSSGFRAQTLPQTGRSRLSSFSAASVEQLTWHTSTNSSGRAALQPFTRNNRALVPAATHFAARIADADLKQKQLAFSTSVTRGCSYLSAHWRRCSVTDVDSDTDRQFAWSK